MRNRREFLKDAAGASGLLFVGCGLADAAPAQTAARARRAPVTIRGRRIKTIDVHAHCAVPKANEVLRRQANQQNTLLLEGQPLADRLKSMDAQGLDMEVLSIKPNWYDANRDLATEVIRIQNDGLAEFVGSHADRFAAFASVALQFPDLAAQQLEQAMKRCSAPITPIPG